MTENQEKEVFLLLNTIVTELRAVKSDVTEIRQTQDKHSEILEDHSQILNKHSQILDKHSQILDKHSQILENHSQVLKRLEAKTDNIAETVMSHELRLTKAEKNIEDLQGGVH
ncbi:MAG: hypothetical protein LUM44_02895 [Pyrinomonadaceae bacterium]|nr:hypothetical protein [Pyrinomonadaceae bacterium]